MTAIAPSPVAIPTGPTPSLQAASAPSRPTAPDVVRRDSTDKPSLPVEKPDVTEPKKEADASPPQDKAPQEDAANPQRPPIRPGNVRSKFDLELNPFEQSFSRSSHSQSSHSDRTTPPRGTDATSLKHNALPPLSSLTSPAAADPSQFPWLAGSLRSGPLSPAMLAGPAGNGNGAHHPSGLRVGTTGDAGQDNFETPFRTGFTPGAGTGFTPGYTALIGSSFGALPLPSPNTAAFLNMVTNETPGEGGEANNQAFVQDPSQPPSALPPHLQSQSLSHMNVPQDTITPNTLSALTGVFNDMNNNPHNQPGPAQQGYFPQTMHPRGVQNNTIPPQADYAQQSANAASQAANGLFLLSQAHHELAKREETDVPNNMNGKKLSLAAGQQQNMGAQIPTPITAKSLNSTIHNMPNNKRKSDGGIPPNLIQPQKGNKKSKKSGQPLSNSMGMNMTPPMTSSRMGMGKQEESVSPGFSMDDDDDDGEERRGSGPGGKETEEEKRKNFLERNRQAALKCRQRKKAWLNELQTKVEGLSMENERLQQTVQGLHDEVGRLSNILMQHRDCGLPGIGMAPGQGVGVGGGYGGRAMR